MATALVVNGVTYSYPQTGDQAGWGDQATFWATAVTNGMLQKAGGTFTLTGDANFGTSFGLIAKYFTSVSANAAASGTFRLANTDSMSFRNFTNTGDLAFTVNASNQLQFNGNAFVVSGAIVNADINAAAAIAYSKLALTGSILNADLAGSIAYSKLSLSNSIVNADIASAAAIAYTKLATMSANSVLANNTGSPATPTSVAMTSAATVSTVPIRDASGNIQLNNLIENGQTVVSAAGTTTLVVGSPYFTQITGSTTQTVVMPAANTLTLYQSFMVGNRSTGVVTVNANGGSLLQSMLGGSTQAIFTVTNIGSTTGVWDVSYSSAGTTSPLTTKGDIYTYSTVNARQPVPSDNALLIADSVTATGWRSSDYKLSKGPKNYIQYGDFENNSTTGWTATGCATVTNGLPVSVGTSGNPFSSANGGQTKGANTNAPAIDSSSALSGTYAMNLACTGAGVIGDGYISSAYTIDKSDQAKVLSFRLSYKVASGTPNMSGTSSNTYAVAVYDVVNNSWFGVSGGFNFVQSSGTGVAQGTFQTSSNTTSIQIFVYSPVAPTGTSSLLFDDVYIGPQYLAFGSTITDWVSYIPVIVGAGTPTSVTAISRRVGDSLEIMGKFTPGVGTAVTSSFSLGYNGINGNVTIDGTKMISGADIVGHANLATSSTTYFGMEVLAAGGGTVLNFGIQNSTTSSNASMLGNVTGSNQINFYAKVPITGWSSSTQQSSDFLGRIVAARMTGATATVTSSYSDVTWTTIVNDSTGSMGTINYTIPVTGYYDIVGQLNVIQASSAIGNYWFAQLFNTTTSTAIAEAGFTMQANTSATLTVPFGFQSVYLTSGTQIKIQIESNVTTPTVSVSASRNFLSIKQVTGPAVVQATELIAARFYNSALNHSIGTTLTTLIGDTKSYDTHNALVASTGLLTAPISGYYKISFNASSNTTGALNDVISWGFIKNGSPVTGYGGILFQVPAAGVGAGMVGSDTILLNAGDTIGVQLKETVGAYTLNQLETVSFERLKN